MPDRRTVAVAIAIVGIVAVASAFALPPQQQLVHDASPESTQVDPAEKPPDVVDYHDLSDRGQTLYRNTLANDGQYAVTEGEGAPDFGYYTSQEIRDGKQEQGVFAKHVVIVERPTNGTFPGTSETGYDRLVTTREPAPLTSLGKIRQMGSIVVGLVFVVVGGYLYATRRRADGE